MSVEASAVVVAVATAAATLIQGSGLPDEATRGVTDTLQGIVESAPGADRSIEDSVAGLPSELRQPAQDAVQGAVDAAAAAVAPHVGPIPDGTDEGGKPEEAPPAPPGAEAPSADGPAAVAATGAAQIAQAATGVSWPSFGSSTPIGPFTLPSIPAIVPGTSMAPIGAIAVFMPWLRRAGSMCPGVTAPVIASLYAAENGFRYGPYAPVSPDGARGPGQFMPGTWLEWGKSVLGLGAPDVLSIQDSVMASGRMLCDNYARIEAWKKDGVVTGDTLDLTIAAYNAGLGAVQRSGGMPSGSPDYVNQTQPYVARIRATEPIFARVLGSFFGAAFGGSSAPSDVGNKIVDLAFRYLGLPYVWGGGNINGPSGGGFDCSGLTSYAVFAASGLTLPRTSETQWGIGTEIGWDQARPGDLVFGNWQAGGPGHVGIYIGNGQMVHAPTTGDVVRVGAVFDDMKVRRIIP